MALKKDKAKVLDEVLDEQRIQSFLDIKPPTGVDADFNVLEKAYRGMPAEYYGTFLDFFIATGRNIDATNPAGKTLRQIVATHAESQDYLDALDQHGASS